LLLLVGLSGDLVGEQDEGGAGCACLFEEDADSPDLEEGLSGEVEPDLEKETGRDRAFIILELS